MVAKLNGNALNTVGEITGTPGDDLLINFTGVDFTGIDLGDGFDVLRLFGDRSVGTADDYFDMGAANAEWFITGSGASFIDAGSSDEGVTITSYGGTTAIGSAYDDELKAIGGGINGTSDSQDFDGGDGNDTLEGAGGDDTLDGGAGDDQIFGRGGDDDLDGGAGNDRIEGGDGNDKISGGGGTNDIDGGAGDDLILNFTDSDSIDAGAGHDTLRLFGDRSIGTADAPFDMAAANAEWFITGSGTNFITAEADETSVTITSYGDTTATGSAFDDVFKALGDNGKLDANGKGGDDSLTGGRLGDTLRGANGDDKIDGKGGDDLLIGGDGDDELTGGKGADTFQFDDRDFNNNEGEVPLDIVTDFALGEDTATFRYDGGFFDGSNQTSFSNQEEFDEFLEDVLANGSGNAVTVYDDGVLVETENPATGRELDYFFVGLHSDVGSETSDVFL